MYNLVLSQSEVDALTSATTLAALVAGGTKWADARAELLENVEDFHLAYEKLQRLQYLIRSHNDIA